MILEGGKLKAEQEKVSNFVCHVYNTELNGLSSHQFQLKAMQEKSISEEAKLKTEQEKVSSIAVSR